MNNVFEDYKKNKEDDPFEGSDEMTSDEIYKIAIKAFPEAQVETDNYGQWVIYTNIKEKK